LNVAYETILYEKSDHIVTITLNRPEYLNAFNRQMQDELSDAWQRVKEDTDAWVVILTGAGNHAFCAGVDVKEAAQEKLVEGLSGPERWRRGVMGSKVAARQNGCYKPVILAINGLVAGGGFYFLNESDIPICAEHATFLDPHVSYARVAALEPIGASRKIALAPVLRLAILGAHERMSAERAYQLGLVTEIVPADRLMARARELAELVTLNAPLAVQGTVEAVWRSLETGLQAAYELGLRIAQMNNFTEDYAEGARAQAEKRKPVWKAR
jgi:enoyl-CoA hydratase/carnithine racemase